MDSNVSDEFILKSFNGDLTEVKAFKAARIFIAHANQMSINFAKVESGSSETYTNIKMMDVYGNFIGNIFINEDRNNPKYRVEQFEEFNKWYMYWIGQFK